MARGAQGRPAAGTLLPRRLHPPRTGRRHRPAEPARGLRHPLPDRRRDAATIAADPRHLGAEIGFLAVLHTWGQNLQSSSAPALRRAGRGPGARRRSAGSPAGRASSCRCASSRSLFRGQFLAALDAAFQAGELSFHGQLAELAEPAPVRAVPRRRPWRHVGGLRQAALRRSGAGAQVSRPLHPPGRHLQPPAGPDRGRQRRASAGRTTGIMTARR